jgi:hypothetical protein
MEARLLPDASTSIPFRIRDKRPLFCRDGEMSIRYAVVLVRLALLFFLAESPLIPLLAGLYPGYVVPIVLAGALVVSVPVGIVLAHALQRGLEGEFAEEYRKLERFYFLAAAASLAGVLMVSLGRGPIGTLGLIVSAGGMLAAGWMLLKAAPAGSRREGQLATPMDPGRLD